MGYTKNQREAERNVPDYFGEQALFILASFLICMICGFMGMPIIPYMIYLCGIYLFVVGWYIKHAETRRSILNETRFDVKSWATDTLTMTIIIWLIAFVTYGVGVVISNAVKGG